MKNLARGSVLLSILGVVIGFIYFQPNVEAAFFQANSSQKNLITENKNNATANLVDDDKLVKKTAIVEKKSNARSFRATAYCLKGRTATGGGVRRGIVAADPRILPLGTRIYLSAGGYSGTYTVTDTGGVIKGRILDVWVPSCSEAMRFGRKNISVSVLGR